jgi:uncharacterized membrane protein
LSLTNNFNGGKRELQVSEDGAADAALEKLKPFLRPEKAGEARLVLTQVVSKSHSGPIPSAEELEHLERVQSGLADRVVSMAEKEQQHRHSTLESIVDKEFTFRKRGQWFMLAALILLLATVALLALLGDTKSAAWLGGATIVAVVSIIVTGRLFDDGEGESKTKVDANPKSKQPPNQKQVSKQNNNRRR